MVQIEINNSYSRVIGLTATQEKELRDILSYTENAKSAYFGRGYARKKSLLSKRGEFPTGLLHRIPLKYHIKDNRLPTKSLLPRIPTDSYEWQRQAVKNSSLFPRGIISAPTGTGKSRVISMLCTRFKKTLIIVPTIEIKKQLKANLPADGIVVENIDSKALNNLTDFDCLIIDEAHHVAAKTYQKLNKTAWKGIYYRYFLTATPFRNDQEEQLLFESIAGQVIYKLDYKEAISKGYIVPIEAYYLEFPKRPSEAYTWAQVYSRHVVNDTLKNQGLINILTTLHSAGKSTLCLVKEVKHGQLLSEISGLPFVHGADEESRKYIEQFNKGQIKVLVGTTGVLGEGIDTKPCEYVVIAGLGKARSHFMQQIGRGLRRFAGKESAKVILVKDSSHKFLLRHFREQCKILKEEYGVTIVGLG